MAIADARTLLAVTQVYPPDPAAVGQHVADVAAAMVRRGWRVMVLTSQRGYDDPSVRYRRREVRDGVEVVRLPLSSFGKDTIAQRLLAQMLFLIQATLRAVFIPGMRALLVSTSPPPAAMAGCAISILRRVPVTYWVMDLNPDQLIATGRITPSSLPARACNALNRLILGRAASVVVLDRFMAQRVQGKLPIAQKVAVIPPWCPSLRCTYPEHDDNPFRAAHSLDGKFVVMYSGNHSPVNPLGTLLSAAKRLRDDDRFVFLFVGGGQGKREVEAAIAEGHHQIRSLPYQPLEELGASLSAADLHVASIGDDMVGIVHPCKIYGAMTVGRPLLTFGPAECHLRELVDRYRIGWHVAHHDVERAVQVLREAADLPREEARAIGERARLAARQGLGQEILVDSMCRVLVGEPTPALPLAIPKPVVEGATQRRPVEVRASAGGAHHPSAAVSQIGRSAFIIAALWTIAGASAHADPPPRAVHVYDATAYREKPDLRAFGVLPIAIVYMHSFWPPEQRTPERLRGLPEEARVRAAAMRADRAGIPVILDIEHWRVVNVTPAERRESLAKLMTVTRWFRSDFRSAPLAHFELLPAHVTSWRWFQSEKSRRYQQWQAVNGSLRPLADLVDFFAPSAYTYDDDLDGWEHMADAHVKEARRYASKPVFLVLCPQYTGSKARPNEYVPRAMWRRELEFAVDHADGVVLWGGWDAIHARPADWDPGAAWWAETRAVTARLQALP